MARLTRSGVAHDLTISPHKLEVHYGEETITYVFSSEFYRNKFTEKLLNNRDKINKSLSNRFGFEVRNDVLADLKLYLTTETRGFLIEGQGDFKCQNVNNIELNGKTVIRRNSND